MASTGISRAAQAIQNATVPGGVTPFTLQYERYEEYIYIYIPYILNGLSLWLASD